MKVIDGRRSVGATEAQKEAMMMKELDTHFVVAVYGYGHTDRSMAIAMEYMPLGSLQNVLQQDKLPSNVSMFLKPLLQFALTEGDMLCGFVFHKSEPRESP